MQLGSFLASSETIYSPRSIEPWVVRVLESCWNSVNLCLLTFQSVGKGYGNPAPKLADRWKSAVWLGRTDLTDEHLVRTVEGCVVARRVRRLAEHSWSEVNLRAVVETPQQPKSTNIPLAAELLDAPLAAPEVPDEPRETRRNARRAVRQKMTPEASSFTRSEKRTETQEASSVVKRLTMKS